MPNLSSLAPLTTAALSLSNLVLVTPQSVEGYQPQNPPNPDGTDSEAQLPPTILFHYEAEQTVSLESDITDHYVENNYAIQDQIALRPELITTDGFIGELNDVVPTALKPIKFIANKLTTIGAYEPSLSTTALLAYDQAFLLYQTARTLANTAVSAWSSISNLVTGSSGQTVIDENGARVASAQNKQQECFQQFYGYWRSRTLFTVQTPWAVFRNMAILKLQAIQDADTRVISDFKVTFKMIRKASTVTQSLSDRALSAILNGRASQQASGLTDLGTSAPVSSISLSSGLSSMGVA